jgi:hypothetical protein
MCVLIGPQAFIYEVFLGSPFYVCAQAIAFFMSNALMLGLFLYYRHKTRDRWINDEAEKWLESRSRQRSIPPSPWGKKIRRGMLWVPTLIAFVVFLFFPETFGIASHMFRSATLDHLHLEVPNNWIIASNANQYLWVVAASGIGRVGISSYWRKEEPVSEMTFSSISYRSYDTEPPAHANVLSKRELPFGNELLICWDIVPYADTRPSPMDTAFAEIVCYAAKKDFSASFSGWRAFSPAFYELLERVTARK